MIEGDAEKAVIFGENPIHEVFVFSYKFDSFPVDGNVGRVYMRLGVPAGNGIMIKSNDYVDDKAEMFQRLWNNRYKNEAIECASPYSAESDVMIECSFCFEGCLIPQNYEYISYQNGQWYWVECETKQVENQSHGKLTDGKQQWKSPHRCGIILEEYCKRMERIL